MQVLETLVDAVHVDAVNHYKAFYSSVIGGITTHPVFMSVPVDDHMVHRGHAVFDTAIVAGGHIYQLDQHVERFIKSAELARIPLPTHEAQIKRIIMDTAAASRCQSGERQHLSCTDREVVVHIRPRSQLQICHSTTHRSGAYTATDC